MKLSEIEVKDILIPVVSFAIGYWIRMPLEEKKKREREENAEYIGRKTAYYVSEELKELVKEMYETVRETKEILKEVKYNG
ncbi:MAG: hypothetical protein ACXQTX_04725 [Candidatus Syntropharchaeia archaeon]